MPHPAATLWLDANVYALARLLWDPQAEPRQLAEEWSALRFGPAAAPHLTALLMRSTEAVLKGFYVGCYSETHPGWAPNLLWVRDDLIGGGAQLQMMYQYCDSRLGFHEALWEKGEAVAIVDQMIADLALAQPHVVDQGVIRWMEASLRYQRSLFESLRLYLTGMFWHYRGNQPLAVESFRQLEESWATHQGSAEAATPFQDAGMWAAVESALRAPSDGKTLGP